ncbi:hypothetical protein FHR99_002884 [Litorivivens lipolytica]|uniref:Xaa-Pro dipeptidyl-peptidase C-terminal domain-containing protein n=1 Tax=Litorivivens lipolytica TaxID=1524264 RepID=A0A7W4W730_9GAMM|nr:CocE/NonD family hydrolase [Litorivivens lipolytica]MBB3048610.1 hypothetical protein [Litorivivens lipolytica]
MKLRTFFALGLCFLVAACNDSTTTTPTATRSVGPPEYLGNSGPAVARSGSWSDVGQARAEDYNGVFEGPEQFITMDDGVRLSARLYVPSNDTEGTSPAAGRFPCVLTQTGYNKNAPAIPARNEFLIRRGYIHISVDVRGTGNSEGSWEAFSDREQADYLAVMQWAASRANCGNIGTWGASFMGITQLYTGAPQHPAHKAIFAIVPMADAYRDIVMTGGQVNIGFIPLWMGLVSALGVVPTQDSASQEGFQHYLNVTAEHIVSAVNNFQVPTIANVVTGRENNYDNAFWRTRSPIEQVENIKVPTFIVGGLNDIFQRGEPLLYEELKDHTTAKLLIGPWQHVAGSRGIGLPRDGVPDLNTLALMWFDRWLKDEPNGAENFPNVTQYYYGAERYATASDWPHPQLQPQRWYLHGDASVADAELKPGLPTENNTSVILQNPANGICSTSTAQWTAGLLGATPIDAPGCLADNSLNEIPEATFTTEEMPADMAINGPIQANLWVSTTSFDANVVVRITEVAPDGSSRELTNGILTASMRGVNRARSRIVGTEMLQPWHPFTEASELPVAQMTPMLLNVEVFPSSFVIKQGHRLRVSIGASDFPHGLPPAPNLVESALGALTIYSEPLRASYIALPVVPVPAVIQ